MSCVRKSSVPPGTLLEKYDMGGGYADCYSTEVVGDVSFETYIFSFYTTPLFKLERWILEWSVSRASTDDDANRLANGLATTFAAWDVESRRATEILLCDMIGRTRSWLMTVPLDDSLTRLYFGSAVVPLKNPKTGKLSLGFIHRSLLGFHQIYSVLLLYAAKREINYRSSAISPKPR